ncbi:hypothetical protein IP90_01477 [Luteimonas cucumeris]|uniref:Uncharacterized protein n=1 Tax=Luteimonas cucumeris TaxID=985012 RepID=A0A562L7P9_9GAMM|nr:hypothetical protein [Luteimonas cucumeris]TWI03663.1 hypothetical protein IP90_01477 [Luteimonas cucumeris]
MSIMWLLVHRDAAIAKQDRDDGACVGEPRSFEESDGDGAARPHGRDFPDPRRDHRVGNDRGGN